MDRMDFHDEDRGNQKQLLRLLVMRMAPEEIYVEDETHRQCNR